jgi:hypothetical protein
MKPAGVVSKSKNNDNKHPHQREDWMKGKKIGRPAQQFNAETNTWGKVMEPRKVND